MCRDSLSRTTFKCAMQIKTFLTLIALEGFVDVDFQLVGLTVFNNFFDTCF